MCLFGCVVDCVSMCLPGGKAYQRDPVEECDSSREKRHYAAMVGVSEYTITMYIQCG